MCKSTFYPIFFLWKCLVYKGLQFSRHYELVIVRNATLCWKSVGLRIATLRSWKLPTLYNTKWWWCQRATLEVLSTCTIHLLHASTSTHSNTWMAKLSHVTILCTTGKSYKPFKITKGLKSRWFYTCLIDCQEGELLSDFVSKASPLNRHPK